MSKIILSLIMLLLLTSCATSKFDFATAYKFKIVKKYPSLGDKNLKVLASPKQVRPNHLSQSKSKIIEIASLKSILATSEDIIHFRLSTYEGLDNMSKRDVRRSNKLNKIITRISDIKFDTIITESGLAVPLLAKKETQKETQEAPKTDPVTIVLLVIIGILLMLFLIYKLLMLLII